MSKTNQLAQDALEARAKQLEEAVIVRARQLATLAYIKWTTALERAARELCEGWEWSVNEFIAPNGEFENAHFVIEQYVGDDASV